MAAFAMHTTQEELNPNETRDTLFLLGGMALMLFGMGLVVTNPAVKKLLGGVNAGGLLQSAVPDLERYMRLRAM